MSEDAHRDDGARHAQDPSLVDEQGTRWRRWSVLLPALTFVAGLALGAAVLGASTAQDDEGTVGGRPAPAAAPAPSPTASDLLVRVPAPCLQAAERAEQAYALVEQGVTAARELDARGLADLVDQVQQQRPEAPALLDACRAAAATAVVEPAPAPS